MTAFWLIATAGASLLAGFYVGAETASGICRVAELLAH